MQVGWVYNVQFKKVCANEHSGSGDNSKAGVYSICIYTPKTAQYSKRVPLTLNDFDILSQCTAV